MAITKCVNCGYPSISPGRKLSRLYRCAQCGTFMIEPSVGLAGKVSLPDILSELYGWVGIDGLFEIRLVPLALAVCSPSYSPLILSISKMLRMADPKDLQLYVKIDSDKHRFVHAIPDLAERIAAYVNCDSSDAEYIVKAYGFAAGILNSIESYSVEKSETSEGLTTANVQLSVSDKIVRRGSQIEIRWKVDINRKSAGRKPRQRPRVHLMVSDSTGMVDNIVGEKGSKNFTISETTNFSIEVRGGNSVKGSRMIEVVVADDVELSSFAASSHFVVESDSVTLRWNLRHYKKALLHFEEDNGVSKEVDVTTQLGCEYTFSPPRDVTVTIEAIGEFRSKARSSLHIGVRRLPRFPKSMLPRLDSQLELLKPPKIDGILGADDPWRETRAHLLQRSIDLRSQQSLAGKIAFLNRELITLLKKIVYVKV